VIRRFLPWILLACLAVTPAVAQIGVSPPVVEIDLDEPAKTRTIRLFNFGNRPTEVQVRVNNWRLDEANKVQLVPPTEQSLDQWIVINPLRFTVQPGRSQAVRYAVRPRVRPEKGEHRAMIYFTELLPLEEELMTPVQGTRALFNIGVGVYAYAGDVERTGTLNAVRLDPSSVRLEILSEGSAHVRLNGEFAIRPVPGVGEVGPMQAVYTGTLPTTPVLPGSQRELRFVFEDPLPPGEYVVELAGALSGQPIDRQLRFNLLPDEQFARIP
jgi:hypothetical protein